MGFAKSICVWIAWLWGILLSLITMQEAYAQLEIQYSLAKMDSLLLYLQKDQSIKAANESIQYLHKFMMHGNIAMEEAERVVFSIQKITENDPVYDRILPAVYVLIGTLYNYKNKQATAQEFFDRAISIYQQRKDSLGVSRIYSDISLVYYHLPDYKTCLVYLSKAEQFISRHLRSHNALYRNILNTKGLCYKNLKQYTLAAHTLEKALYISKALKDTPWIGLCSGNLAEVYYLQGKYTQSLKLLKVDIENSLASKLYMSASNALRTKAEIYLYRRDFAGCKAALDSASQLASKGGDNTLKPRKHIAEMYVRLLEAQGLYSQAFEYQKQVISLSDSLNLLNKKRELEILQNKYEYQDAKKELKILAKDNSLKQTYLYFTLTILVLCVVMVVGVVRSNRILQAKQLEIAAQNDKLESLNHEKDLLISVIGHDFRSPVAATKEFLTMQLEGDFSMEEAQKHYPTMLQSLENTLEFADNILQWAGKQIHGFQINPIHIALHSIVQQMQRAFALQLSAKQLDLCMHVPSQCMVYADEAMLNTILRNLVNNAIKFSLPGGKITIEAEQVSSEYVEVCVRDTGVGIPPDKIQTLFSHRVKSTLGTAQERGHGFGLRFCKDFVELNGGTIRVQSELHVGTSFYFTLHSPPAEPSNSSRG